MIRPEIKTSVGGSVCVVTLAHDHYIDARNDVRTPDHVHIEAVQDGQVYGRQVMRREFAPAFMVEMMHHFANYGRAF